MFAAYMNGDAWDNRSHRGWTTLLSFLCQSIAICALLLIPLLATQGLPSIQNLRELVAPAPHQGGRRRCKATNEKLR